MAKRKREKSSAADSQSIAAQDVASGATREGSVSDGADIDAQERPSNDIHRTRTFLASLACEQCRAKKTKCDEDRPKCGQCKSSSIECVYGEKRFTKKDQSLNAAVNAIRRLETKIEDLTTAFNEDRDERRALASGPAGGISEGSADVRAEVRNERPSKPSNSQTQPRTPVRIGLETTVPPRTVSPTHSRPIPISFSQHATIQWDSIRSGLSKRLQQETQHLGSDFVIEQESQRPPLSSTISCLSSDGHVYWARDLPEVIVRALSDLYFLTFNRISPILDREFYDHYTLVDVIHGGFPETVESCVVLNVLALGCLALQAYEEGNFSVPADIEICRSGRHQDLWSEITQENPQGLRFFNEGRKLSAFLQTETSLQACQNLLLSALWSAQIVRPMDSWTYLTRACYICIIMVKLRCNATNDWADDMLSRVFWSALMSEAILVQELDLPPSGLVRYEDDVQLPRFVKCPHLPEASSQGRVDSDADDDEAYFQYHFLAQVAHRIILTRVRNSIYFVAETADFPPQAVVAELYHQLEQWREALPSIIQFAHDESAQRHVTKTASPAHAVADAILRSRYRIAKFHIGRPFLCKVLQSPSTATQRDLEACASAFEAAMWWPAVQGICQLMKSFSPLKFAFSCQFVGQQVLYHAFAMHPLPALQNVVPRDWYVWSREISHLLSYCASLSPAVATDFTLFRALQDDLTVYDRQT
ncbi:putative C6 finger domain protein [Pseudovirgaria hyperparasitica]|uniref:Putative C6 finger domain protein n=1 Tax=Pseudovirgaria hyperparasitica TaxID=470096 RepID=A0A6A6WKY0_9PEZI|nr:putative C6 finger domain protein [Pseudovirgaria hyperparasitica]KAF2762860.1 putative C6 finger domain protein [Pseudovirgaria hyperparasitica]